MRSGVFFSDYASDLALRKLPLEKLRMALFLVFRIIFQKAVYRNSSLQQ